MAAPQKTWIDVLKENKDTFEGVLGDKRPFEAWWTTALAWCAQHPVTNISSSVAFLDAYMDAAKRGLMIDGSECMVQVRGKESSKMGPRIKCEVGYRGVIKQAGDAGIRLDPHAIFQGDDIEIDEGSGTVKHQPAWIMQNETGELLGFYCVITYEKTGLQRIVTMSVAEAQKRSTKTEIWNKWPVEMGKKSVVLRAGKTLHFSDETEEMARIASSFGEPEGEEPETPSSSAREHVLNAAAAQANRDTQDADAEAPQKEEFNGPPGGDDEGGEI